MPMPSLLALPSRPRAIMVGNSEVERRQRAEAEVQLHDLYGRGSR